MPPSCTQAIADEEELDDERLLEDVLELLEDEDEEEDRELELEEGQSSEQVHAFSNPAHCPLLQSAVQKKWPLLFPAHVPSSSSVWTGIVRSPVQQKFPRYE